MDESYLEKSEKTWNNIAKSFDITRKKPWVQCLEFINNTSKNCIIADIGCGNGRHLLPAAKQCKHVFGLDISSELLYIIKKKLLNDKFQNVSLIHSDVVNIPLKNNSINAVLFIASLHNIEKRINRLNSLKEVRRILKKDGLALISVWSRWQDKYKMHFLKKWFTQSENTEFGDINIYWKQHGLNIPRFYHLYSKKEFKKDLIDANLKILESMEAKMHSQKNPDNFFALVKK